MRYSPDAPPVRTYHPAELRPSAQGAIYPRSHPLPGSHLRLGHEWSTGLGPHSNPGHLGADLGAAEVSQGFSEAIGGPAAQLDLSTCPCCMYALSPQVRLPGHSQKPHADQAPSQSALQEAPPAGRALGSQIISGGEVGVGRTHGCQPLDPTVLAIVPGLRRPLCAQRLAQLVGTSVSPELLPVYILHIRPPFKLLLSDFFA